MFLSLQNFCVSLQILHKHRLESVNLLSSEINFGLIEDRPVRKRKK